MIGFIIATLVELLIMFGMYYLAVLLIVLSGVKYYIVFAILIAITVIELILNITFIVKSIIPFKWYYLLIQLAVLAVNIFLIIKLF